MRDAEEPVTGSKSKSEANRRQYNAKAQLPFANDPWQEALGGKTE